jgi:hypothetical protein
MHWVWGGADDRVNLDADFAYLVRIEAEVRSADSSRSSTCSASTIWRALHPVAVELHEMTKATKELNEIIRSASLVPAWDSLGGLQLLVAVAELAMATAATCFQLRSRSSMAVSTRLSTAGRETARASPHSTALEPLRSHHLILTSCVLLFLQPLDDLPSSFGGGLAWL